MAKIRSSGKSLNFINSHYSQPRSVFNRGRLAAVVYADLFGYPLTVKEAKLWDIRQVRAKYSSQKEKEALKVTGLLKKIPTVAAVFLTGSVAAQNATSRADIDLMIVTQPNTLWLTRLLVFPWLKRRFCPNIFLDLNHLEIKDQNLFTAHEILQAKCLYDRDKVERRWLKVNLWTKEYLPEAYKNSKSRIPNPKHALNSKSQTPKFWNFPNWTLKFIWNLVLSAWNLFLLIPEFFAFLFQYLYMKPKMTHERVGWGFAFFHPYNLSEIVVQKFEKKLLKYTHL
ncbi:nucleotidyltransferase domain-containing protein [Patescibacteria group bacterium]|nr:nucleotidyltransferase domain-containing protein [Patescibacteria group bacterium]